MTERKAISHKLRVYLFQKQEGKCGCGCGEYLVPGQIQADHIRSLEAGGDNGPDNWMLMRAIPCHRNKSIREAKLRAKVKRLKFGRPRKSQPMAGTRASGFKKRMDGVVERR